LLELQKYVTALLTTPQSASKGMGPGITTRVHTVAALSRKTSSGRRTKKRHGAEIKHYALERFWKPNNSCFRNYVFIALHQRQQQ
jgi:hypothetical protein